MRKSDFDVVDTLLHDLSVSTTVVEANGDLSTCRDTSSTKDCGCGSKAKPKPAPKPKPKTASLRRAVATKPRMRVKH